MLDIKLVRESPEVIIADLKKRGEEHRTKHLEQAIELDREWRKLITEINSLRQKRNEISLQIAKLKKQKKPVKKLLKEAAKIPEKIKKLETRANEIEESLKTILMSLPNILHESVPVGKDESENVTVRRWGEIPKFNFKPKDHIDLGLQLDLIELERAAKVAGSRMYYLKNELVELNQALINFGLQFIKERGFQLFQTPYLIRKKIALGATDLGTFEDSIYKIENEDLFLLPTSEFALLGLHFEEILDGDKLPLKYAGISPCFRKEAGAHGRDTKGIFRVHQFEKVEQFIFCKPEQSWQMHEELIKNAEEFFQMLKIPYRVVNVCTGDIGSVAAKKYDLEAWLPGQNKYREVVSCSNCTDYQARRSGIRFREKKSGEIKFVHTLNSTLVATERALIAIMENYQQPDGTIVVPEVLRPFMHGKEKIGK